MSWHTRFITNDKNHRISIQFEREDLLWIVDTFDQYRKLEVKLPLFSHESKQLEEYYIGPNIIDLIECKTI
jgi:hypothetical protein